MTIKELAISDKIRHELGEDGLRDLCASMWAVDCQTCGGFLGDETPALCVDDSVVFAHATLHHQACRAPEWNDSGVVIRPSGDHISYITTMLMLPLLRGQQGQLWPMMLINRGWRASSSPQMNTSGGGYGSTRASARPGSSPSGR